MVQWKKDADGVHTRPVGILENKEKDYKVVKFILEDMVVQSEQGQETNQVQGSDILNELIKCSQRNNFKFFLMVRKDRDRSIIGKVFQYEFHYFIIFFFVFQDTHRPCVYSISILLSLYHGRPLLQRHRSWVYWAYCTESHMISCGIFAIHHG